jgi:hypothetical protein
VAHLKRWAKKDMSSDTKSEWAVAACGQAGSVEIDFMSSVSPKEKWLCELRMSAVYLTFEVSGLSGMRAFSAFVERHAGRQKFKEERIGSFSGCEVFIIKDDEHPDRFFLRARGAGVCFDVTFRGEDSKDLGIALKSLVADLA